MSEKMSNTSSKKKDSNTKINDIRVNLNLEYSEELKLNVRCGENDSHVAVLYCIECKANLCVLCSDSLHSRKVLSSHKVVRLTQKPEPPIYCHLHPMNTAEIVCKEPSCTGMYNPICTKCHQYEKHKGHAQELVENEYNQIQKSVKSCLKEIEKKLAICEQYSDEYDNCIATYSCTDEGFMKDEREKAKKLVSDFEATIMGKFDGFVNGRVETLKLLQKQYTNNSMKLEKMSSELRNIAEMKKVDVIKSGKKVEQMVNRAGKNIDEPTDLVPSTCYKINHPTIESLEIYSIKVVFSTWCGCATILKRGKSVKIEETANGNLYKYEDGQTILHLKKEPDENTIDLLKYKYIVMEKLDAGYEQKEAIIIKKLMNNKLWSKILLVIGNDDWRIRKTYVSRVREVSANDPRVSIIEWEFEPILKEVLKV